MLTFNTTTAHLLLPQDLPEAKKNKMSSMDQGALAARPGSQLPRTAAAVAFALLLPLESGGEGPSLPHCSLHCLPVGISLAGMCQR